VHEDIGKKLLEARLIDPTALGKAQQQMKNMGGGLTATLVKIGALTEESLLDFLSRFYGVPAIDLRTFEPDLALTRLLPAEVATKFMALPVSRSGRRLIVAMANPTNIFAIDDIKFITGFDVRPVVATETAIKRCIDRLYDAADSQRLLTMVCRDLDIDPKRYPPRSLG
jgi:type IV pilus assembly protein PilB